MLTVDESLATIPAWLLASAHVCGNLDYETADLLMLGTVISKQITIFAMSLMQDEVIIYKHKLTVLTDTSNINAAQTEYDRKVQFLIKKWDCGKWNLMLNLAIPITLHLQFC